MARARRFQTVRLSRGAYIIIAGHRAFSAVRSQVDRWVLSEVTLGIPASYDIRRSLAACKLAAQAKVIGGERNG